MCHARRLQLWTCCLLLLTLGSVRAEDRLTGVVYRDADLDGKYDAGDKPLAGVCLSDGEQVVVTDGSGRYRLARTDEPLLVRLSVPNGYWPTDGQWFRRVAADAVGPVDFPLRDQAQPATWRLVQVTDIHYMPSAAELIRAFVGQVDALRPRPALIVATGDLVMDSNNEASDEAVSTLFAGYLAATAGLSAPLLNVPGNHDHPGLSGSLAPTDALYCVRGFETLVGPAWYSLNYGGVHLVALDATNVGYGDGLSDRCGRWLRRDLLTVPTPTPLLVFCHQPPSGWDTNGRLASLLSHRRILALGHGHLHSVQQYQWAGIPTFEAGALSGSWWRGPGVDGNPRGFRVMEVSPSGVTSTFVPAEGADRVPAEGG